MKTFLQILLLLCCLASLGQTSPIDFEPNGNGASWTWNVFEMGAMPLQFVANPDASSINTSSTVASFTAQQANVFYTGCVTNDIAPFTLNTSNSTVKIMVYKSVISNVGIKFEAAAASTGEILVANTLINQWEELTFDFSGKIGEPSSTNIDGIAIFPDYDQNRQQDNLVYFDNITFGNQASAGATPLTAAPDPTIASSNVISLYSDVYTDVPVDTWNTSWSAATLTDLTIQNNPTKRYSNLNFNGVETIATPVDASQMDNLHLDVWSNNSTAFRVKLVDFKGDGFQGSNGDTESELTFTLTPSAWNSLIIPLSDFTAAGITSFADLSQYIISSDPAGTSNVFIDNVYFSKNNTAGIDNFTTNHFTAFPNPSKNIWNFESSTVVTSIQLFNASGQLLQTLESTHQINNEKLATGIYFAKITDGNISETIRLIKN